MRKKTDPQISFAELEMNSDPGPLSRLLQTISIILDSNPQVLDCVANDFNGLDQGINLGGRPGMTVEQVVRSALAMNLMDISYRGLEALLKDCRALRNFCRMAWDSVPSHQCLCDNIKVLSEETWSEVNAMVVRHALELKIDRGNWVRGDTTAVESNIHHPTDSGLLTDCHRVLTRIQHKTASAFGDIAPIRNRKRIVTQLGHAIRNIRGKENKIPLYRSLINHIEEISEECRTTLQRLKEESGGFDPFLQKEFIEPLAHYLALTDAVVNQARRRVLQGEKVPAEEKILSIFEPHADILEKGAREVQFGHKVLLAAGKSGLIFHCEVLSGNPCDSSLFLPMMKQVTKVAGKTPSHVAVDDGFASYDNATLAMVDGVKQLAFGGKLKYEQQAWVSSRRVQKTLRRFRAGIEGIISAFKRGLSLDRCTWKGWEGFQRYVLSKVVTWNLRLIAQNILKT